MKKLGLVAICLLAAVAFSGCAALNTYRSDLDINKGVGATMDVKQRAIIVALSKDKLSDNSIVNSVRVCAEPSPDAMSAYAAELAGKGAVPNQISAEFSAAFQESASFVGLRTQTIQLLRDSQYRICESYLNGAINNDQYATLMRRYQRYMVALLAVEQLTGTLRAPNVTINTEGLASAAKSIQEMMDQKDAINKKVKALEASKSGLDAAKDKDKISSITNEIEALNQLNKNLDDGIKNANGIISRGSATATINNIGMPGWRSDEHIQKVAETVKEIVLNILDTDDFGSLCWAYLKDKESIQDGDLLGTKCGEYMDAMTEIKMYSMLMRNPESVVSLKSLLEGGSTSLNISPPIIPFKK